MSVSPPNTELARRDEGGCTVYTALRNGQALGYVAVDSTVAGRSCGGVRIATGLSDGTLLIFRVNASTGQITAQAGNLPRPGIFRTSAAICLRNGSCRILFTGLSAYRSILQKI